ELEALATDQGLPFYLAGGLVLRGWAMAEQGQTDAGLAEIERGFGIGGATRAHWRPYLLTLHADALGKSDRIPEAIRLLNEALDVGQRTSIRMYEPEIHRLSGEFQLALDGNNLAPAEASFHDAIRVAREQRAKSLELRATMSLARLRQQQNRASEGHAL